MAKKDKKPEDPYKDNKCEESCCGQCRHMTNVPVDQRKKPCVMGGCFLTGMIVFTDLYSCDAFEPYEEQDSMP